MDSTYGYIREMLSEIVRKLNEGGWSHLLPGFCSYSGVCPEPPRRRGLLGAPRKRGLRGCVDGVIRFRTVTDCKTPLDARYLQVLQAPTTPTL